MKGGGSEGGEGKGWGEEGEVGVEDKQQKRDAYGRREGG